MDYENLQKINDLAKTLMSQGICSTMDEALDQAKTMIGKEKESLKEFEEMSEEESEKMAKAAAKVEGTVEKPKENIEEKNEVSEMSNESAVVGNHDDVHSKMMDQIQAAVQNVVNEQTQEILKLKDQVVNLSRLVDKLSNSQGPTVKEMTAQAEVKPEESGAQPDSGIKEMKSEPKQEEKKGADAHPKIGDIGPDDVSIEKYFYFGNKK
ncbi:hypothetical protein ACFL1H_02295 [Nanoarchaeota archaeon]